VDGGDLGVGGEAGGDDGGVLGLALEAEGEGLDAAQGQPSVERARHRAGQAVEVDEGLGPLGGGADDAAGDVAVAA